MTYLDYFLLIFLQTNTWTLNLVLTFFPTCPLPEPTTIILNIKSTPLESLWVFVCRKRSRKNLVWLKCDVWAHTRIAASWQRFLLFHVPAVQFHWSLCLKHSQQWCARMCHAVWCKWLQPPHINSLRKNNIIQGVP